MAICVLHHVLPSQWARFLREMRRVTREGGEIAVMEPFLIGGKALKPIAFPEPYLKDYLGTDWDVAFKAAGFGGSLSIGQFVLFETLLLQLVWPLEALGWITNLGQRALASAGRSFAWLEGIQPLPEPVWSCGPGDRPCRPTWKWWPGLFR